MDHRRRLFRVLNGMGSLAAVGCGLATILGWLGGLWWVLDLLSHFRVQYLWILFGTVACLVWARSWRMAGIAGIGLLCNLASVAPLYLGTAALVDADRAQLSLLVFNVNYGNSRVEEIAQYMAEQESDVVVIVEATEEMQRAVTNALPGYHLVGRSRTDAFGMVMLSKLPYLQKELLYLGGSELVTIAVQVQKGDDVFSIMGLHTMPPVDAQASGLRDRMMADAFRWAERQTHPILVGDFNATPWSASFARLTKGTLHNSQRGYGVQTSWPNQFWPLSIPIDHGVIGESLTTVHRAMGPFLGSDHRPLQLTIGFAAAAQ